MTTVIKQVERPSKEEQRQAMESFNALTATLDQLKSENPEIEIEETEERIKLPLKALKLLAILLRTLSEGKSVSIVASATEMTTQAAAEFLGCSRPHLVKLLEEGKIPFTKIGRHRRILFEDLFAFKKRMKQEQKALIIDIMKGDEELGLYDT